MKHFCLPADLLSTETTTIIPISRGIMFRVRA